MEQNDAKELLWFIKILSIFMGALFLWMGPAMYFSVHEQVVRATIAWTWLPVIGLLYVVYIAYKPQIVFGTLKCWILISRFWKPR